MECARSLVRARTSLRAFSARAPEGYLDVGAAYRSKKEKQQGSATIICAKGHHGGADRVLAPIIPTPPGWNHVRCEIPGNLERGCCHRILPPRSRHAGAIVAQTPA